MVENYKGFYKVSEDNGGVCVCGFYNPETEEYFSKITWDIDRPYINNDEEVEILRYMQINKEIRWLYLHRKGIIQVGDTIKVIKGRKLPIGKIAVVKEIKPYKDRYGRTQAMYLYFTDGTRTNMDNCILE